jgi:hypothetical protein
MVWAAGRLQGLLIASLDVNPAPVNRPFEVALFECIGVSIDVFPGLFVLVLLLVIVIEKPHSITSTSTIRLRGLSTST